MNISEFFRNGSLLKFKTVKKLGSSLVASSAMTLFSYLVSILSGSNLKEPYILGQLTNRLFAWRSKRKNLVTGWLIHYIVGLLFAELYAAFSKKAFAGSKEKTGLVFGGLAGLAAILIWKFTLSAHPFSPPVKFGLFSLNLFVAHLIFGLVLSLTMGDAGSHAHS